VTQKRDICSYYTSYGTTEGLSMRGGSLTSPTSLGADI